MNEHYIQFLVFRRGVEDLLKVDDIEAALNNIFELLNRNKTYIENRVPPSEVIKISAAVSRLKNAFHLGVISWELLYEKRSELIEEILILLDNLQKEAKEGGIDKRNSPRISGIPPLFLISDSLERIENILSYKIFI